MEKGIVKSHDFEDAKQGLEKFSKSTKMKVKFKEVETRAFIPFFSHKVTGSELNELATNIQEYLIALNNANAETVKQFGEVYRALEALDNDYIQSILVSVKSAEEANNKAVTAHEKIAKTVNVQKQTLQVLEAFKERLDQYEHLEDVDKIWELAAQYQAETERIQANLIQLSAIDEERANQIAEMFLFKQDMLQHEHLGDIDELWEATQNLNQSIENIHDVNSIQDRAIGHLKEKAEETEDKIDAINQVDAKQEAAIEDLKEKAETAKGNIDAINQVDAKQEAAIEDLKEKAETAKGNIDAINQVDAKQEAAIEDLKEKAETAKGKIDAINQVDAKQEAAIEDLKEKAETAKSKIDAINQVDAKQEEAIEDLKEKAETAKGKIDAINQVDAKQEAAILNNQEAIRALEEAMRNEHNLVEKALIDLHKKLKIAYSIAGAAVLLSGVQLLLNLLGVI